MSTSFLFRSCSLLMAFLFALSASFQFNDPDWYLWLPLYATASIINLINGVFGYRKYHQVAKFALWLGLFLFAKVVVEDFVHRIAGFLSFDMMERVVREKFGSGFVIICMFLQSKSIQYTTGTGWRKIKVANYVQYGMAVLVVISYAVSLVFFLFQKREMKICLGS